MDLGLQILDMAGARREHSDVIVNFVSTIRHQLKMIHFPNIKITFDELFEEIE